MEQCDYSSSIKAADNGVQFSETESIMFDDRWGVSTAPAEFGGRQCGGGQRKQTCSDGLEICLQCLSNFAERIQTKNTYSDSGRPLDRRSKMTDRRVSCARSVLRNKFNTRDVSVVGSASVLIFFFSGATAQRRSRPPHSGGFQITHNDTPQSVGLLWTSDRPLAETST